MTPTFRGKGDNLGIIHISHIALITPLQCQCRVVFILACGPWCITPSTVLLNDALRFWITTKLTLINTKIITEAISIIVSQLQSKHTN